MKGMRLARILGFEIRLDFSWFIILFLIVWSFSSAVFPRSVPDRTGTAYLIAGVVGALLFFASLLAHELAHSVVARIKGIPVEGITLFIFGGVSRTRMEADSPGDEFLIAGVGPLMSLLLAGVFYLLAAWSAAAGADLLLSVMLVYLAYLNLLLAIFNLLPGFPLDGGRLLRSIVWKITGNLHRATRIATTGGRVVGFLIVALGILEIFTGNLLGGLWLVFIGWFLSNAASSSYRQHVIHEELAGYYASEAMTAEPETVAADVSIEQLVEEHFLRGRHHAYPVTDGEHAVGIVTLTQVKQIPRQEWALRRVRDAMTPIGEDNVVRPDAAITDVLEKLSRSPARRVLVSTNGHIQGIITANDITRFLERSRLAADPRKAPSI